MLTIAVSCESVVKEAKKFITLCYKTQEELDEKSKKKLFRLAEYAKSFVPCFTAAGFFDVNKFTFFGGIGTIATYFIIVVQFNNNQ